MTVFKFPRDGAPAEPPVRVGDSYDWIPSAFLTLIQSGIRPKACMRALRGRVVYVNRAHRYYTVAADCNGYTLRESFKF